MNKETTRGEIVEIINNLEEFNEASCREDEKLLKNIQLHLLQSLTKK